MNSIKKATFAGGCFWCMVKPFDEYPGVIRIVSGYTGGAVPHPTYEEVCTHQTGHKEAVEITYDEDKLSFHELVDIFFRSIDPTDAGGQFGDRGDSYTTAIFYHDDKQKEIAENYIKELTASGRFNAPIVVSVLPAMPFYEAEDYHQDYYKNEPLRYHFYHKGSGRGQFLEENWKQLDREHLRATLSEEAYHITQENGTELPFHNAYHEFDEPGIYVDIVSGKPLFSSKDKFASHCGWPAFGKPIAPNSVYDKPDTSLNMHRVEIRSRHADSHLGHVFEDGPEEFEGLRYCINSAALKFIPKDEMEATGYGAYLDKL